MTREQFFTARANTATQLYVNSIFETIDGETNQWHAGAWSVFIRLQGCRVGCTWCDTKYSWDPVKAGVLMTPGDVIEAVHRLSPVRKITLTGGEPMEQWGDALSTLLSLLAINDYRVSMETAGSENLSVVLTRHPEINFIVDYKMPSAHAVRPPCISNYTWLRTSDVVKIVADIHEVEFETRGLVRRLRSELGCAARIVVSPVWTPGMDAASYVEAARRAGLGAEGVGLSFQTHKWIWPENVRNEEVASAPK